MFVYNQRMKKTITVNPRCEKKLRGKYPWIYANEITSKSSDIADVDIVSVVTSSGAILGTAYFYRHSLIQARILSWNEVAITTDFFVKKITSALDKRTSLYPSLRSFRLIYGESDGLPGLVVDKYENLLVVELNTQGMYQFKQEITDALAKVCTPQTILLQNNSSSLSYEKLQEETIVLFGPEPQPVIIDEFDVKFLVDPIHGQKTGFFMDQKENRRFLAQFSSEKTFLDTFAYSGAWGMHALKHGAKSCTFVDSSAHACDLIRENLRLNGFSADVVKANAFDYLREASALPEIVVLDPPAFAKTKKDIPKAEKAYTDINRIALKKMPLGGILAASSCSFHMSQEAFYDCMHEAALQAHTSVSLIGWGTQAYDHPVMFNHPESLYLKTLFVRKELQ